MHPYVVTIYDHGFRPIERFYTGKMSDVFDSAADRCQDSDVAWIIAYDRPHDEEVVLFDEADDTVFARAS